MYYLHNGSPIFCHKIEDITAYRYIFGNLIFNKLCTAVYLAKALGVNIRNIERYAAAIRDHGSGHYLKKKTDEVSTIQ